MKVAELKSLLEKLEREGKFGKVTVEVVHKDQKYFVQKLENPAGDLSMLISRGAYHPLQLKELKDYIVKSANSEGNCWLKLSDQRLDIQTTYLSDWCLELIAAAS